MKQHMLFDSLKRLYKQIYIKSSENEFFKKVKFQNFKGNLFSQSEVPKVYLQRANPEPPSITVPTPIIGRMIPKTPRKPKNSPHRVQLRGKFRLMS